MEPPGEDVGRVDLEGTVQIRERGLGVALAGTQAASAGKSTRVVRVEPDRLVVVGHSRIKPVERGVGVAAPGVAVRVVGTELDRLVVLGDRLLVLASAVIDLT